jgi:hypothetical protein
MYAQGTVMPEMSDLIYRNSDLGKMGRLFRFHGFEDHGLIGCVSNVGAALFAAY